MDIETQGVTALFREREWKKELSILISWWLCLVSWSRWSSHNERSVRISSLLRVTAIQDAAMRIYQLGVTVVHWGQRSSVYSMIRMCCHGFLSFSTLCPCYYKAPYSLLSLILFFLHLTQVDLLSTDDSVPLSFWMLLFLSQTYTYYLFLILILSSSS